MVKRAIAAILLLPVLELVVFLAVSAALGLPATLLLAILTSAAGFLVLRQAGSGRFARFRAAVSDGIVTGSEAAASGFLVVLAGIMLLLPGFVTDTAGALLLIRRCAAGLWPRSAAGPSAEAAAGRSWTSAPMNGSDCRIRSPAGAASPAAAPEVRGQDGVRQLVRPPSLC